MTIVEKRKRNRMCKAEHIIANFKTHDVRFDKIRDSSYCGSLVYTRAYRLVLDNEPTKAVITFCYNDRDPWGYHGAGDSMRLNREGLTHMVEAMGRSKSTKELVKAVF